MSLHKTTPSFSDVFKKSSGSAMFFLGELSTPNDISHVTVCSSGFIAPPTVRLDLAFPACKNGKLNNSLSICYPHPYITLLLEEKTSLVRVYPYRLTGTVARPKSNTLDSIMNEHYCEYNCPIIVHGSTQQHRKLTMNLSDKPHHIR